MHYSHCHSLIPLERYREIMGVLSSERDSWDERFWLRFAAQVAVLHPDPPTATAERIRSVAGLLAGRAQWFTDLAEPSRFVVAAMLVQHHIPVSDFLLEYQRIVALLDEVDLRHDGFPETVAVVILHLIHGHRPLRLMEMQRLRAIYDRMKHHHWWLTGLADVPACAALSQCPGSATEVEDAAEDLYRRLHAAGLDTGDHLRTTASLLCLLGLPPPQALERYLGLRSALLRDGQPVYAEHYQALAVLAGLDQEPEVVAKRLEAVHHELDLMQSELAGRPNLIIASDLAFLDLVRFDRAMAAREAPPQADAMLAAIHSFHLATAVLVSQVSVNQAIPMVEAPTTPWPWPYAYSYPYG
jgi:hypothetical protein